MNRNAGTYISKEQSGEVVRAYIPEPLPPHPPLSLDSLLTLIEEANLALGRLDGLTSIIPDLSLFLYAYVRKEAVLSSQIEGTQSSLSDLLLFETEGAEGVPIDDVQEVSNYVAALNHGMKRIKEDGFPLSLRLIREIHQILLSKGRGESMQPGEFRRSQNWVGGTRPGNALFVPPPPESVLDLMGKLEKFFYETHPNMPPLLRAGLAHVQFETIHPFIDGNGRLGRLLITFLLCCSNVLREPILYLSLYFKTHRDEYYRLLMHVREAGDWESWMEFFLRGVRDTADSAVAAARELLTMLESDRRRIDSLKRATGTTIRLHKFMETNPIFSIPHAAKSLQMTYPTVAKAIRALQGLSILNEISGKERGRIFAYESYLEILSRGTAPLKK